MKVKKYWILIATLGICAGVALAVIRSDDEIATSKQIVRLMTTSPNYLESDVWHNMKEQTLTGLNAVGLIIYKDHWDFNTKPLKKTCSVEKGALQAMVTNKLKIAGLRILSNDELLSEPGSPLLVVHINTRGPTDIYITGQGQIMPSPLGVCPSN